MRRTSSQLREDALAIWTAGVEAVASDRLVNQNVRVEHNTLKIVDDEVPLSSVRQIAVVGAGKAGAGMAAGLEVALGAELMQQKRLSGWINVPADCITSLNRIHLHAARPAGVNEPTEEGVQGSQKILELVAQLGPEDLCICLLSGGGSALLPSPASPITLYEKQCITKHLSGAGANIEQLNTVRKQLSRIKGGGLARACRAGRMITLIISDVLGDPLDVIASGPTVPNTTTAADAIDVLRQFPLHDRNVADPVTAFLRSRDESSQQCQSKPPCPTSNHIIGNNAVAVDAAGIEAERRGYSHAMVAAVGPEGEAESIGIHLARLSQDMRNTRGPDCLISGGEPTVTLVDAAERGLGGRNQQLVLAALTELGTTDATDVPQSPAEGLVILSGGTDGEDGPTDAAGALIDADLAREARKQNLNCTSYLHRNDAYHFFEPLGGLIQTGPTHTNVCDIRVVVVDRVENARFMPTPIVYSTPSRSQRR